MRQFGKYLEEMELVLQPGAGFHDKVRTARGYHVTDGESYELRFESGQPPWVFTATVHDDHDDLEITKNAAAVTAVLTAAYPSQRGVSFWHNDPSGVPLELWSGKIVRNERP